MIGWELSFFRGKCGVPWNSIRAWFFCIILPVPLMCGYDGMIKYNFFHLLNIRELKMAPCHANNPKLHYYRWTVKAQMLPFHLLHAEALVVLQLCIHTQKQQMFLSLLADVSMCLDLIWGQSEEQPSLTDGLLRGGLDHCLPHLILALIRNKMCPWPHWSDQNPTKRLMAHSLSACQTDNLSKYYFE